jgi:hypothetical protein
MDYQDMDYQDMDYQDMDYQTNKTGFPLTRIYTGMATKWLEKRKQTKPQQNLIINAILSVINANKRK